MKVIECYGIYIWDGGDRQNFSFYVATKEEADKWTSKHKYDCSRKALVIVFDSIEEMEQNSVEAVKKRALAKLDPQERAALGF